ncbi:MAG: DUF4430 domain-containing protein [Clostridiales bacterium]|nr:DUF4430 domain-containing protein [Clostridiales bacterium]
MYKIKRYYKVIIFLLCLITALVFTVKSCKIEKPNEVSSNYELAEQEDNNEEITSEDKSDINEADNKEVTTEDKTSSAEENTKVDKSDSKNNEVTVSESKGETTKEEKTEANGNYCTLIINCNTINSNKNLLKPGKEQYVPSNGIIYSNSNIKFEEGTTAFDVLYKETRYNRIPLDYTNNAIYNTNYITGINNIYEKDCGENSGWIYKVNGGEPNYGSSNYKIKNGDVIEFIYTCSIGDVKR